MEVVWKKVGITGSCKQWVTKLLQSGSPNSFTTLPVKLKLVFFTKVSAIKTLHSMYLCGPTKQNTPGLGGRYCVTLCVFSMWYPVYFENIFSSIFRLVFVPTHLSTLSCSIHYLITWWQRESMISECQWWIDWYAQLLEASLWEKGFRQNFALSFFLFLFQSLLNLARLW